MTELPFSDKYRPRKNDELILNNIIRNKINHIIENKNITNLIFTGKSGQGKTSTIHYIVKKIYHKNDYQTAILELNASDDRGIKSVNEVIQNFCKKKIYYKEGYAQHKTLILDEADNLTSKAQKSINLLMEQYPDTKFVFTCNYSQAIIEPIQSRCTKILFNNNLTEQIITRIKYICEKENIKYDNDNTLNYLIEISNHDIRKIINNLELVTMYISKFDIDKQIINIQNINNIIDIPSQHILENILNAVINKNYTDIFTNINEFKTQGYYALDIILHFIKYIEKNNTITNNLRNSYLNILCKQAFIISKTRTNYIQLTSAFLLLCDI